MGAWIETFAFARLKAPLAVTPHVGVWIETRNSTCTLSVVKSLPMWECGLKPPHSPEQGKGAHGEDNYPCDAGEVVSLFANVS